MDLAAALAEFARTVAADESVSGAVRDAARVLAEAAEEEAAEVEADIAAFGR